MIPIVKGWSTEIAQEVAYLGVQVHGGMGFIEETGAAQHYRDARITTIYEGTTAIQANDLIGRKTARDGGAVARSVIGEIAALATALERRRQRRAQCPSAMSCGSAAAALKSAVDWVVPAYGRAPRAAHAASVPYLRLWGLVAGGWQLARGAQRRPRDCSRRASGDADVPIAARSPPRASTPSACCRRRARLRTRHHARQRVGAGARPTSSSRRRRPLAGPRRYSCRVRGGATPRIRRPGIGTGAKLVENSGRCRQDRSPAAKPPAPG